MYVSAQRFVCHREARLYVTQNQRTRILYTGFFQTTRSSPNFLAQPCILTSPQIFHLYWLLPRQKPQQVQQRPRPSWSQIFLCSFSQGTFKGCVKKKSLLVPPAHTKMYTLPCETCAHPRPWSSGLYMKFVRILRKTLHIRCGSVEL